ncbi:isoform 2 of heterogeneous nuclear ribonucleoprotein u-like protein 1 [Fagus crenata]
MTNTNPDQKNICRIDISGGDDNVGGLGEIEDITGIFYSLGKVSDQFDEKLGIGDTIVCAVNLEDKSLRCIDFFKNRKLVHGAHIVNAGFSGLDVVESTTRMAHGAHIANASFNGFAAQYSRILWPCTSARVKA